MANPSVIRFASDQVTSVPGQAVYLKASWDGPWTQMPELWCREAVWAMSPSLSTAELVYRYGDVLPSGAAQFAQRAPLDRMRWYVRVDFTNLSLAQTLEQTTRSWYGVIDAELDEQLGPRPQPSQGTLTAWPRGRNHWLAYGLEAILAMSWIDQAAVARGDGKVFVGRALPFNPGLAGYHGDSAEITGATGEGNRSTFAPEGPYVFHDRRTGGQAWSTADAVEYLLWYGTPRDYRGLQRIRFRLEDVDQALPTWDRPIETCEHRTVFDLLNSLVARQRCLAWRAEVRPGGAGGDEVAIVPCTFLSEPLFTDDQQELKANPHQVILSWERDRGAEPVIRRSATDQVEQVIVRGDLRTSTATFSFEDGTLDKGWPPELETAYEEAASTAADYPPATEGGAREIANIRARASEKFRAVFARFTLPDPFDGYVGDGTSSVSNRVLMPSDANPDDPVPHAPNDQRFLSSLALLEGVEYDGAKIGPDPPTFGPKPRKHKPPLVLFPHPNVDEQDTTQRYMHADRIGMVAALPLAWEGAPSVSASVRVEEDDGALWVEVGNGFNFEIAKADFNPLPDDYTHAVAADYRTMLATLTVPWSFFAEGRYPEQPAPGGDVARTMVLRAPQYRVDYVVPGTVVGLNELTGELLRTETGGFVRDDRPRLKEIARLAFEWYGRPRKAVTFSTSLVNNRLQLGDLVVSIGDPEMDGQVHTEQIHSVITQIRIVMPLAEGEGARQLRPPVPRIEYQTAFGELDALALVPRLRQR